MEYLQDKEYFPFKTVIIDDSLQITLVQKIIWNLLDFNTCKAIVLNFMEAASYFSYKYSI